MTEELPELEPFEDSSDAPPQSAERVSDPAAGAPPPGRMPAAPGAPPSLPAPAYNPGADKEYHRFLFAGVIMLIGCVMPWGVYEGRLVPGYYSLAGALSLLVSAGMVWTWWGAISSGRFGGANLKWVLLALLPLLIQVLSLLAVFKDPDIESYVTAQGMESGWGFFGALFDLSNVEANADARGLLTLIGPGRFVFLLGAVLAELFFLMAIFGGAKAAKKQKSARQDAKAGGKSGGRAGGRRR